jgi:hypothetical protein
MYRRGISSRTRKLAIGGAAAALLGGALAVSTGMGHAGESCAGLDQALKNNLTFIAGQQANPDAQSTARIANRQAVVDLIQQRRQVAGCTANVAADNAAGAKAPAAGNAAAGKGKANGNKAGNANGNNGNANPAGGKKGNGKGNNGNGNGNGNGGAKAPAAGANAGGNAAKGSVVCPGSTVTLSGEGGAPAAASGQFPIGTTLKVTNLDNNKSTTVKVASVSGSCALLNNAAFEQVREAGKFLIRRAVIEKVG